MGALTLSSHVFKEILDACSVPSTFLNPRFSYPEIKVSQYLRLDGQFA